MRLADLVVVRGSDWLSNAIIKAESAQCGHLAEVSHTIAMVSVNDSLAMEAISKGVTTDYLGTALKGCAAAYCITDTSLSDRQRMDIQAAMLPFSAQRYGYPDLVLQLMDSEFHTTFWTDEIAGIVMAHTTICSFWPVKAYEVVLSANRGWGTKDTQSITPQDIFDAAKAQPERYALEKLI